MKENGDSMDSSADHKEDDEEVYNSVHNLRIVGIIIVCDGGGGGV